MDRLEEIKTEGIQLPENTAWMIKEIELYKRTVEHDTKEIKLLTTEIDQKDEEIERLKKENGTLSDECITYTKEIERLKKLVKQAYVEGWDDHDDDEVTGEEAFEGSVVQQALKGE